MADNENSLMEQGSNGNPAPAGPGPDRHRRRKRKVKRSSRVARKAWYVVVFAIAVTVLFALWYYLINRPTVEPPS